MEIKKVNLDRSKLSSSYIEQKQDFNKVLNDVKITKTPTWKSPWFYGAVGLSSLAISAICLSSFSNENIKHEKKATLKKEKIQIARAESKPIIKDNKNQETKEVKKNTFKELKQKSLTKTPVSDIVVTEETVNLNVVEPTIEPVAQKSSHSGLPSIGGKHNGTISVEDFMSKAMIESNSNFKIIGFKIQYFDGSDDIEVQVSGNNIPEQIAQQIVKYNLGQMIFFTEIKGMSENGKLSILPSMNFKLTR